MSEKINNLPAILSEMSLQNFAKSSREKVSTGSCITDLKDSFDFRDLGSLFFSVSGYGYQKIADYRDGIRGVYAAIWK
jgi:hypothetical protein